MLVGWFKKPNLFIEFKFLVINSSSAFVCAFRVRPDRRLCKSTIQRGIDIVVVCHTRIVNAVLSFFFVGTCVYMRGNGTFQYRVFGES